MTLTVTSSSASAPKAGRKWARGAAVVVERRALASPGHARPTAGSPRTRRRRSRRCDAGRADDPRALPRGSLSAPPRPCAWSGTRPAAGRGPSRPGRAASAADGRPAAVLHVPLRTASPIHPEHKARDRLIGDDGSLEHRSQRYRPDRKACPEPCPELGRYVPKAPGSLGSRRRFLPNPSCRSRTTEPKVRGSNPLGRVPKLLHTSRFRFVASRAGDRRYVFGFVQDLPKRSPADGEFPQTLMGTRIVTCCSASRPP